MVSLGKLRTLHCRREEPLGGFLEQKLLTGRSLPPRGAQASSAKQPWAEEQQLLLGNALRKEHQNMEGDDWRDSLEVSLKYASALPPLI